MPFRGGSFTKQRRTASSTIVSDGRRESGAAKPQLLWQGFRDGKPRPTHGGGRGLSKFGAGRDGPEWQRSGREPAEARAVFRFYFETL